MKIKLSNLVNPTQAICIHCETIMDRKEGAVGQRYSYQCKCDKKFGSEGLKSGMWYGLEIEDNRFDCVKEFWLFRWPLKLIRLYSWAKYYSLVKRIVSLDLKMINKSEKGKWVDSISCGLESHKNKCAVFKKGSYILITKEKDNYFIELKYDPQNTQKTQTTV